MKTFSNAYLRIIYKIWMHINDGGTYCAVLSKSLIENSQSILIYLKYSSVLRPDIVSWSKWCHRCHFFYRYQKLRWSVASCRTFNVSFRTNSNNYYYNTKTISVKLRMIIHFCYEVVPRRRFLQLLTSQLLFFLFIMSIEYLLLQYCLALSKYRLSTYIQA